MKYIMSDSDTHSAVIWTATSGQQLIKKFTTLKKIW